MPQLLSKEAIDTIVSDLAEQIRHDERVGEQPLLLGVLNGAFVFMADLVRVLSYYEPSRFSDVAFIGVSSYGRSQTSSGKLTCTYNSGVDVSGRVVLIVEDIVDSGRTLALLQQYLQLQGAERVLVCSLLVRRGMRHLVDFTGRVIEQGHFAYGYGLDLAGQLRGLPDIHTLKK